MEKVYQKSKKICLVITTVLSMFLLTYSLQVPVHANADTIDPNAVYVATSNELKNALANSAVSKIVFTNDIVADSAMRIAAKRLNPELIIDGNGYTLTERFTSTYSTNFGIHLRDSTTIDNIVIENMNIVGRNGYGTIYTSVKVNQEFRNVTYVGPQMIYNNHGTVKIQDSVINIGLYNNNTYNGEVAEVNRMVLAGNVNISKVGKDANEIFWLKNAGAALTVESGAVVTISNESTSTASGLIYASSSYNFTIEDNAVFNYNGNHFLEETTRLSTFNMGENAAFNVHIRRNLSHKIIYASNAINVGKNANITINIDGDANGYALYAKNNLVLEDSANATINANLIRGKYLVNTLSGDIILKDNATLDIHTNAVNSNVIRACDGSIRIQENGRLSVTSNGAIKAALMWVKQNLTVEKGAVLDLIANNNTNTSAHQVLSVDGASEAKRSTVTFQNPKRVLVYNDNISSKTNAHAISLGNRTTVNITAYNTEYWRSARQTGGTEVLANANYRWQQDPDVHGFYNIVGISTNNAKAFNSSFAHSNYHGVNPMNANQYYFGRNYTANYYEVCLWQGEEIDIEKDIIPDASSKNVIDTSRDNGTTVVGNTVTYTITVDNAQEQSTWRNVQVIDTIATGLTFNENSVAIDGMETNNYTFENGVLTVNIGDVIGGHSISVTFSATVNGEVYREIIQNTATIIGENGTYEVQDNGILVVPDTVTDDDIYSSITVENLDRNSNLARIGDTLRYTITLRNTKMYSTWEDVKLYVHIPEQLALPAGFAVYINDVSSPYTYDEATRLLTIDLGDMEGGDNELEIVFDFIVQVGFQSTILPGMNAIGNSGNDHYQFTYRIR